eukprot:418890_1
MAFINRDIWLNWTCRYCGQSGTKYGPSFTSRNRKVKHSHCNRTTGIVQWTGCSQSAHPLLCINLHGINVVPQPITDIQNIDRQIVIDDENEPYMNNVMDEDESIDDNDKENISVLSNTNSAALGVAGAKRTFGEMMESDEISSAEKFEVCSSTKNKRLKILRPCRMGPRNFKIKDNCHLLHGAKQEFLLHLEYLKDSKPSQTKGKIDKISKENCMDRNVVIKKYSKKRKDNHEQMPQGGQRGSKRKFDPTKIAQQIDGRPVALNYLDHFPIEPWF